MNYEVYNVIAFHVHTILREFVIVNKNNTQLSIIVRLHKIWGDNMSILYDRLVELCEKHGITGYKMCKEAGIAMSTMTDLKMGRKKGLNSETAAKLAEYFGVSVNYLLGMEEASSTPREQEISEDDLKFALFKGEQGISDEAYEEVKAFAEFVRQKYKNKK